MAWLPFFPPLTRKNLALRYFTFVCNSVYLPHLINNLCYSNSFSNPGLTFRIHVQCSSNTTDSRKHTIRKHVTFNHILNSVWHLYVHWPVLLTNKPFLTIYNKCTSKCLLNCSLKMALKKSWIMSLIWYFNYLFIIFDIITVVLYWKLIYILLTNDKNMNT